MIVSDSWSDPLRNPWINFIDTSGCGHVFLKAKNCSSEIKDKFFIGKFMKKIIHQMDDQNIVSNNAPNCMVAWDLIKGRFLHISWTPCVVHTLNLALRNICAIKNVEENQETYECNRITEIHGEALAIN